MGSPADTGRPDGGLECNSAPDNGPAIGPVAAAHGCGERRQLRDERSNVMCDEFVGRRPGFPAMPRT
jgi:hypothetical protein